jgi:hypothetical protein
LQHNTHAPRSQIISVELHSATPGLDTGCQLDEAFTSAHIEDDPFAAVMRIWKIKLMKETASFHDFSFSQPC